MSGKRELYRNPERGKLGGVCAGVSDYFNFELWLVRIIFISAVLLAGGPLFIVAYIAAWLILEKKPAAEQTAPSSKSAHVGEVKAKVWQKGEPPRKALKELKEYLGELDNRIQHMETHVTSPTFTVDREINKL
ncbi:MULTISPECIES: envelope stress response membrane protein PspC [Pseudoalteromonas]|uniref:Envelope stress response membrane protein PspC n=1 Tax=Pseudoalteromonas ruthenica TaxID=151081 RepID=A0A0F4Q089_9GAMM|nr:MULTISPECIES: envelope stress response membrane protein PspC [Pseudoalteromonas]KJZ00729.1 phage-shock protein [Pseudoalteromonas ruthenica]KJZ01218.1 phage-shock protein [Pseudoalteromonas ruthenica]MCF2862999.1 envelope stress response membrane protein PspC [Pseudoalteromonas sp. CNAT2-18]MCG7543125.1 envelope stress response membrane protein PspC [Pseudoalteromonas sp. MM17-2]MCG7559151.1 envelope stress response membrane protein PspC [Pseudoalteromonas sp. CNAT2-18.1]|tara:strand:- start:13399 stop:13797 length:399 start_codon:yes stop_codon:yes gene_type:complete